MREPLAGSPRGTVPRRGSHATATKPGALPLWEQEQDAAFGPAASSLAAAGAATAASATISDLPDELLGLIMVHLVHGATDWLQCISATQVCKRWNIVFFSDHCVDIWRWTHSYFIAGEPEAAPKAGASHLHFFQRASSLCQGAAFEAQDELCVCNEASRQLPNFLEALVPAQLTHLRTEQVPLTPATLHALARLRHLCELDMLLSDLVPSSTSGLAGAVGQLLQLQRFELIGSCVEAALVRALSRLPRLERIGLHSRDAPLPSLDPLAALGSSLTSLAAIEEVSFASGLNLGLLAALPKLARVTLGAVALQVPGMGSLIALYQGEDEEGVRTSFTYGLPAWVAGIEVWRSEAGLGLLLHNVPLDQEGAGTALLTATKQPPGSLQLLWLQACSLAPAAFKGSAAQLAAVERLVVQECQDSGPQATLAPALGGLIQQTLQLRSLDVTCSRRSRQKGSLSSGPPREVARLRHLTALELYGTCLPHLGGVLEGLTGLVHLDLRDNRLQRLPTADNCTQLTALLLTGNDSLRLEAPLLLSRHSRSRSKLHVMALRLLASLPALKRLELPHTATEAVKAELAAAAPHIEEVVLPPLPHDSSSGSTEGDGEDAEE